MLLKAGRKGRSCTLRGKAKGTAKTVSLRCCRLSGCQPSFRFAILKGQKEEKTSMSATGKNPLTCAFIIARFTVPQTDYFIQKSLLNPLLCCKPLSWGRNP